jgi:hypothetical protein
LENLSNTKGLAGTSTEFVKYGTAAVGLIVGLVPLDCPGENASARELCKLTLHGSGAEADCTDNLALVEALIDVSKEQTKRGLPRGAKERRSDWIYRGFCRRPHIKYNCTQFGVSRG